MCLIHSIGGAFTKQPEELNSKLSTKASDLIERAFDDIDPEKLIDHHVHIAGLGASGNDYPLPAVNLLIRTRSLVKQGYINNSEAESLKEIYDYNPLLFDFVLKRTLRLPGTSRSFPPSIFMTNLALNA